MKIKINRLFCHEVVNTIDDDDNIDTDIETFKEGEIYDVLLLEDHGTVVDIQFGDGGVAFRFPKEFFDVVE
jgi:hypothetical protein